MHPNNMIEITNYVSKILLTDKNSSYSILTYLDFEEDLTETFINNYINQVLLKNPILKKIIVKKDDTSLFLDDAQSFNINDNYNIKYINKEQFDDYIKIMINKPFSAEIKWNCLFCIDKDNKKSRMYFKIHHAYADGYKLIDILVSPFNNIDITKQFKRSTQNIFDTIYYYIIGAILLTMVYIRFIFNILIRIFYNKENQEITDITIPTDYIICKNLKLDEIKTFTKKHNITVNDFLYSLMIKTDNLYRKQEKILLIISPINVSGLTETNNMCPIFNIVNNSHNNTTLLDKIHNIFNNLKYSLFIPGLSFIINNITSYIPLYILSSACKNLIENIDYTYSNIIGPSTKELNVKISDIHFLTTANNKEIIFNIISCENNMNIICSFKKNGSIKNKEFYEKCIYEAYNSLLCV